MLHTAFTELVGCAVPVQQAPMGPISAPGLVLAVAAAGGVGTTSVPLGISHDDLVAQLDALSGAKGVLAANFLTDDVDPAAVAIAAARVRIVEFFWSTPDPALVAVAHAAGALVGWQVGSLPDAVAAARAGVDVVTVQGTEAGGHVRGESALLPLLASVLDAVEVPVVAAGGIADARTLAAVLAAGASGARMGTRFIASQESGAHPEYILEVLAAGPDSTTITDGFAVCPLCASLPRARVLRSALEAVGGLDGHAGVMDTPAGEVPLPVRFGMPPHKGVRGEVRAMALYAGQGVHLVNSVEPVGTIMLGITDGAEELLRAW